MPYGPEWRLNRRIQTSLLSTRACEAYCILQDIGSKQLSYEMLTADNFTTPCHRFTSTVAFALAYGGGLRTHYNQAKELKDIDELTSLGFQAVSIGSFLVDIFPILDRVPIFFSSWKKSAEQIHENMRQKFTKLYDVALQDQTWNWARQALKKSETQDLSHEQRAFSIGELYLGVTHSNHIVLEVFVMASILHQSAVQQAQQELDSVIGSQRLPLFEDATKLPYVNAFITEILRWCPVLPLGFPHRVSTDDEYMGYKIPSNSIIFTNQWQMNMDEKFFDNPDCFEPERWIQNPDLPLSAFGFGRRSCPGECFARYTLFIAISRLLWAFNITGSNKDDLAHEKAAKESGRLGVLYRPSSFGARFQIRSSEHERVIKLDRAVADEERMRALEAIGKTLFSE
ncbi:cytochrome P450 [Penicillium argentinense]|uniref:Cytochrome P450 n=1 Tax=Penicillium argentinense TaxID=1131581 RepID=A0A9W9G448_9EURO|nr:cytochrome P450 [Penicillium argentinense]KAJ5111651.1 cytochrome P450 [Penicillium argentinense]